MQSQSILKNLKGKCFKKRIRYEEKNFIYDVPLQLNLKFYVKKFLSFFLSMVYTVITPIIRPEWKKKKYYVSICAIFRDEDTYLKEWIEFHIIIGIDHFYLYNNFSTDNYKEVLAPYIQRNLITLIDWPVENGQLAAYADCISKYGEESNWIGFIDLDEFVVPNKYDSVHDILAEYEKHSALLIYWKYFGTSGLINRYSNGLIIEDFTVSWKKYANIGKCFFNTSFAFDREYKRNSIFHHTIWGNRKFFHIPPVNVFHKYVIYDIHRFSSDNVPIQINHYLLKSYNEYVKRKSIKGGGTHGVGVHDKKYFYFHEQRCQGTDHHIYKYLIKTKLALMGDRSDDGIDKK